MPLLLVLLWSWSAQHFHPIHLSVLEIELDEAGKRLAPHITLFQDDFADAIQYERHAPAISQGKIQVEALMLKYLRSKLKISIDERSIQFGLARIERDFQSITCYLALQPSFTTARKIKVESTIMFELFSDQRNLVQISLPGKKEGALVLDRRQPSGEAILD